VLIEKDKVYMARTPIEGDHASYETYRELAFRALSALEVPLPTSGTILLKPNATVLFPADKRVITHPGFVAGMLEALRAKGVESERLLLAEGQSGEQPQNGHTWESSGYQAMIDEQQVQLSVLNDVERTPVDVPGGVVYQRLEMIAKDVADCAFFFNVPLAKCHNLGCTTLSIKNLMGILDRPERHFCNVQEVDKPFEEGIWRLTESGYSLFEDRFYHKLCDTLAALRSLGMPRLCMVDGVVGRDGTAFNEGKNYPLGWTLLGDNEVHVDAVATYLMGMAPEQTPYLQFAALRELGSNKIEDIEVIDLDSGQTLAGDALAQCRSAEALMPYCRLERKSGEKGYYKRFRSDGSAVPWRIDDVNEQRRADGLEPIDYELVHG
jgi:uncharacterized protein (DUF362 family)